MDAPPLPRNPLISFTSRNAGSIPVTLNTLENSFAMKKIALALLLAFTMLPAASFAQVVVRIGPPPPIYEYRGAPPDRGYVWISGYHRYEGDHYVWTPGRWERPPHEGQRWVAHRWRHRGDHYEMEEGHWR
jgi:hypothetical protein